MGQVVLGLGTLGAVEPAGGFEAMAAVRAEVPLSHRVAAWTTWSAQRWSDGGIDLRDGILGVEVGLVKTATAVVRTRLGVTVPLGSVGQGLAFTPLSTGSFDPWLSVGAVAGQAWLAGAEVQGRVPLYRGFDGRRQGPFVRVDLRGARRLARVVPWAGLSGVVSGGVEGASASFGEVAAIAGATWTPTRAWGFGLQGRVPLHARPRRAYAVAIGLDATWVVGRPVESHEHGDDEGDEHGHDPHE